MAARTRRRRNGKVYLFATLVVAALLWVVYWYGAQQIVSAVVDRTNAAANARGYALDCQADEVGGFPLSLSLSCARASVSGQTSGLLAAVDGFSATAPLYRPGRIESAMRGPLSLDDPGSGVALTANWLKAETELGAGLGGLSSIATVLEELQIAPPPDRRSLPFDGLAIANTSVAIAPGSEAAYLISASAQEIAVATNGGGALPQINIEAELTALAFGDSLGLDPRNALRDWLENGAKLQIDNLAVATDTVSTAYSGVLDLAPDGSMSGDLKLTILGLESLPDLIDEFRPGSRDEVAQIAGVIAAFSKPVETPAGTAREMPILIRDNVVSIGIIPIGFIPRLSF